MAISTRIPVSANAVFPCGAFMVGQVEPVEDFDRALEARQSGRDPGDVQMRDKVSGRRIWQVRVVDADPDARKGQAEVVVKIEADLRPVPPSTPMVGPFRPVAFEGLTVTPWIDENGRRPKLAYSLRATGLVGPNGAGKPARANSGESG